MDDGRLIKTMTHNRGKTGDTDKEAIVRHCRLMRDCGCSVSEAVLWLTNDWQSWRSINDYSTVHTGHQFDGNVAVHV